MSEKSITKNYIYNLVYQIMLLILPLITTPYISRVLGAEGVGTYSFTLSIVTYFILFGSLGISMYGQREIAYLQNDRQKRSKIFFEIITLRAITLTVSMIIFYFTYANGGEYSLYYKIFILEILANIVDISWFFQGLEDFKKTVFRSLFVKVLSILLIFTFVKTQSHLWIYILIYAISILLGNLSLWMYLPKYVLKVKFSQLNIIKHIKPTISLFIPQIAIQIYTVLDKTMIGLISNMSEVGYYEQAQKIVKMALAVVTALGTVMSPRIANTYANKDKEKVSEYLENSFNFVWFLSIPIMFGIMGIANTLVPWFYGDGFEKVKTLLLVISPIILAIGLNNVTGIQYLIQTKQQNIFTITVVIGAILNFSLNMFLIPKMGAIGASIASVLAEIIIFLTQLYFVRKSISIKNIFTRSIKYLISGIIMFVIVLLVGSIVQKNIIGTMIQVISGILIYFILLFIMKDSFVKSNIKKIYEKVRIKNKR